MLTGNTRTSVIFEPLWGIPYTLYTFYLSLYMKEQGITDTQLGYLISVGFIAGIIMSALGGFFTDRLGRKKTTIIFDLISWPGSLLLYLISGNFWMFALAQVVNSFSKIVMVSWNLLTVEDAGPLEQVAAYNLINAINISVGIFTPLAGILVRNLGIINGEKIILVFSILSMTTMILARNHYFQETKVGREILDERKKCRENRSQKKRRLDFGLLPSLIKKPLVCMALIISILFNAYLPIGTFQSLYYAPYLTEVLNLDKSAISILGFVSAVVMLLVFSFLTPRLPHFKRFNSMALGIFLQITALIMFILIPPARFGLAILCVFIFALGYGLAKPFIDSLLPEVTAGKERAGIYTIHNTAVSIFSAILGFASGYLYEFNPDLIYIISISFLIICILFLKWLTSAQQKNYRTNMTY
jgi:MFS family permease